jgi:endonuclease/exonuclease/phosphatase family metal-dependent hydrolase
LVFGTYNVWGLPAPLTIRPSRLKAIARELANSDVEVWAFQETFTSRAAVLAQVPSHPHVAFGPGKKAGKISSGLMTVSRHPIEAVARLSFSRCAGTDCLSNKGALYTRIRIPGGERPIHVFNTHLTSAGSDDVRDSQVRELLRFIATQVQADEPVVVAGDFNFTPDSQPYFRLRSDAGWRDVQDDYRQANPWLGLDDWLGYTYDPDRNTNLRAQVFSHPTRIDYVWIQGSSRCLASRVEKSGLVFDERFSGRHLSDHFGVRSELRWELGASGDCQP